MPSQAGVKRALPMSPPVAKVSRPTIVSPDDEEEETTLRQARDERDGALQPIEAALVLPEALALSAAPVLLAAAVVAAVADRVPDADGGYQAMLWYGEKRNVRIWPLHPTVGPNGDAWLSYIEKTYDGRTYRFFLPGDPDFGGFHNFGFPSDGTDAINRKTKNTLTSKHGRYPSVSYKSTTEKTKNGAKKEIWQYTHQAVAFLYGAPKLTANPMSSQVVTDHRDNDKLNSRLTNLQLITGAQNLVKDRDTAYPDGLQPIKPALVLHAAAVVAAVDDRIRDADGGYQASLWYGEKRNVRTFPLHPTEGPNGDAWLPYIERIYKGTTYRFFLPGDPDFGGFHNFGFPSDGSYAINWDTKKTLTSKHGGYPSVCYLSTSEMTKGGAKKMMWQYTHQAVAFLYGAPKLTAQPMSLQLVTDHRDNSKLNNHLSNLNLITQSQNSVKDRDTVYPNGLWPIKPALVLPAAAVVAASGAVAGAL